jgi:hypothetical protein
MLLALVAAFALVAAGCGGDDDDDDDSSESDDTAEDASDELSDDEVLEELCAIDADIEELDEDLSAAGDAEDVDAFRDAVDRGIELTREAEDLPLDQLEPGLEDAVADQIEFLDDFAAELAEADDWDEVVEIVNALEDPGDPIEEFTDEECGSDSDDTTPGTDDTTPETDDTTPDTADSDGTAAQIVDGVLGQTPLAGGPEAECIVAGLEETFDGDELGGFLAANSFSEDDAIALSEVFEACLPYQDLIANSIDGQLGDEVIEECVIASYAGYDWVPIFSDPQGEQAVLQETVQVCSDAASGGAGAPTPNPPGTVVDLFDANVGDCYLDAEATAANYTVVDCAQPHDREVFALFDLPDGPFPGEQAVADDAVAGCIEEFEAYVGIGYDESALFADQPITPSEGSWDGGDREVICLLYSPDGQIEGSGYQAGI